MACVSVWVNHTYESKLLASSTSIAYVYQSWKHSDITWDMPVTAKYHTILGIGDIWYTHTSNYKLYPIKAGQSR